MWTGIPSCMQPFDAHLGGPVEEFQLAFVGGVVRVGTGGAEVVVGDDLQDVRGAEFANSAVAVEWVMVGVGNGPCTWCKDD